MIRRSHTVLAVSRMLSVKTAKSTLEFRDGKLNTMEQRMKEVCTPYVVAAFENTRRLGLDRKPPAEL